MANFFSPPLFNPNPFADPPLELFYGGRPYIVYSNGVDVYIYGDADAVRRKRSGIQLHVDGKTLEISGFFTTPDSKEAFRRDPPWPGFGARGMRLINEVKTRLGCDEVIVSDAWNGKYRDNSARLQAAMVSMPAPLALRNRDRHYRAYHDRFEAGGVLDAVRENGWYGAYGFVRTEGSMLRATELTGVA
jgi:hypothetical protein